MRDYATMHDWLQKFFFWSNKRCHRMYFRKSKRPKIKAEIVEALSKIHKPYIIFSKILEASVAQRMVRFCVFCSLYKHVRNWDPALKHRIRLEGFGM